MNFARFIFMYLKKMFVILIKNVLVEITKQPRRVVKHIRRFFHQYMYIMFNIHIHAFLYEDLFSYA
jgi:hypothetical protein